MSLKDGARLAPDVTIERDDIKVPVLLVDDTPANLLVLTAMLSCGPYDLRIAVSGHDAIRQAEEQQFAVILLGTHMRKVDVSSTAARLNAIEWPSGPVPIIFVTSKERDTPTLLRAYADGAVDCIENPLVTEVVRAKVAVFARLHRARQWLRREQEKASRVARLLTDLAQALSNAGTPADVAAVVVDQSMRAAQADTCSLYLLSEDGLALDLLGWRNVAPELVEKPGRLTEATDSSTFAELYAGAPRWADTLSGERRLRHHLVRDWDPGARTFCRIPLLAEGRPIGLLGMGFHRDRRFEYDERNLMATMAKQCAQALLRAVRLEREWRTKALLATTLRSIGEAVVETDAGGGITFMNAAAEDLTGWNEAEARGRTLEEVFVIFSEGTRYAYESRVTKALHEGEVVGRCNRAMLRSRSGTEIPVDDRAVPIRDDQGILLGVVLIVRNASTEKRA
jgi:PAS domain S-box-containing protein